ncbi:nicastrin-like isoform X2 [Physella acuta]|uniref:nicastrin-like isoform X2 n=1 Tax=Physella acuta TaxID=109671 RepID=UPI0027DB1866|nr:nicastrin-like isoform X2 [Physella acuta]
MADSRKKQYFFFICITFLSFHLTTVWSKRTNKKIYINLKTQSACFRNLNATHQVGCTSNWRGNVGTIHYIQSKEDFAWILSKGQHAPYVALLNSVDFTGENIKRLYTSGRVNGIMVINTRNDSQAIYPAEGFSSVDKCPNDRYGLYSDNPDYQGCKKVEWNKAGTSLHFSDIGLPVFALSDPSDVDAVLNQCFYRFNQPINETIGYPVCAAEMKSSMEAAVDSVTCLRRSDRVVLSLSEMQVFCDQLGDKNVVVNMKPVAHPEPRQPDSVIMVAAKLDSASLFQFEYYAADTTVVGIVAMLSTIEALWKMKHDIENNTNAKDIMFTFFQGESFDYIGSSRVVYDMEQGVFPQAESKDKTYLSNISLEHINQIVEINQVGYRDGGSLWAHTDVLSRSKLEDKITKMIKQLQNFGQELNVGVSEADKDLPLPPASAQRFLKRKSDIPVVVLTDHSKEYKNKFYNSHLDSGELIDALDYPSGLNETMKYNYVTTQAELITNLSSTLARYLYTTATGYNLSDEVRQNLTADSSLVTHLLYCFLVSPNCELFHETIDTVNEKSLNDAIQPFPFYVSVKTHTNEVTRLVYALVARFTGDLVMANEEKCKTPDKDKRYNYQWMQGNLVNDGNKRAGWCYKSLVQYTEAVSPAFKIDGYDMLSGQYSTWTESRWGTTAIGVRLFLVPSQNFQLLTLCIGLALLLLSSGLIYLVSSSSDTIFPPAAQPPVQL